MHISETGIALIKSFEGYNRKARQCKAGVWTIGYGHTGADVTEKSTTTKADAEVLLQADLKNAERYVNKLPYTFNQSEYDALVSFTFNCGSGNLSKLCKYGKRTKKEIAVHMLAYNKVKGVVNAGLVRRRQAEQRLFLSGSYAKIPETRTDSIVKALNMVGVKSSFDNRKYYALLNGIESYRGTAKQNIEMLELLYSGLLRVEE